MGFLSRLSDHKSQQVTRTLQRISIDLNSIVDSMVSIFPLISNTFPPQSQAIKNVPSTQFTTGFIVNLIFQNLLSSPGRSMYISLFPLTFIFTLCSAGSAEFTVSWILHCMIFWQELRDLLLSPNPWGYYAFHSVGLILVCAYLIVKDQLLKQSPVEQSP